MASEIAELINALNSGSMSLDEVAQRFRERSWPAARPERPYDYLSLAEAATLDPEPDVPGTFDEVVAAYGRGRLTWEQYRVLAEAVAASKNAHRGEKPKG